MSRIFALDCTLRDGGYCNQWLFGNENIKKIIQGLLDAGIDIIECGYLTNKYKYNVHSTRYTNLKDLEKLILQSVDNRMFVCMINYGEYNINNICVSEESMIDGLRIAFHKEDMISALSFCRRIQDKGYKVFLQPMVSLNYSDGEFLELIYRANELKPYAFYIVDSFGAMKQQELVRLFHIVENNLNNNIKIGFHSHNNMQLSYSNAQALVSIMTQKDLIIDTSIFGMGKGGGNLNTELFIEYLNESTGSDYHLKPLLSLIDKIIGQFHQHHYWGYSLPYYLSAKYNTHPNYIVFLCSIKTITIESIDAILSSMDDCKRMNFDRKYIEKMYTKYLDNKEKTACFKLS